MATGFMPNIIALVLVLACMPARAGEVALIGVIGDKAAVLAVDGGDPKTVKVGQHWNGVTVVAVEKERSEERRVGKEWRSGGAGETGQQTTEQGARGSRHTDG